MVSNLGSYPRSREFESPLRTHVGMVESADTRDFMKKAFIENIYTNRENRKFVVYKDEEGDYHSMSYARYLMETHLGRELLPDEEVHHIDGDKTHDELDNLQVINRTSHRKLHSSKYHDTLEVCCECGKIFTVTAKQHSNKAVNAKRGHGEANKYFCSKQCIGRYGQRKQQEHQKEKSSE